MRHVTRISFSPHNILANQQDAGPTYDIVMWKVDGDAFVVVNSIENNLDLGNCKVMRDYKVNQEIASFEYVPLTSVYFCHSHFPVTFRTYTMA
jgi:hypothetical protein